MSVFNRSKRHDHLVALRTKYPGRVMDSNGHYPNPDRPSKTELWAEGAKNADVIASLVSPEFWKKELYVKHDH